RELYAERVAWIKEKMPHACIGVDVIVGFPGESEEDFLETYHFLNDLDISYLHVFTYSERPNTPAAEMPDQVSVEERRRRNEMLTILSEKKKRHFYNQHLGETRPVLFEQSKTEGKMNGFTENYIRVELDLQEELLNTIAPVQLNSINSDGLMEVELAPNLV
ncbi:MAG: tRNA (N(6)-L-threonylcarbamoyladenosine(37)-C(2))-methylthiotransferase MtaB, partial [Saprospiraceae bacterium]